MVLPTGALGALVHEGGLGGWVSRRVCRALVCVLACVESGLWARWLGASVSRGRGLGSWGMARALGMLRGLPRWSDDEGDRGGVVGR